MGCRVFVQVLIVVVVVMVTIVAEFPVFNIPEANYPS
jgi:hypothetical protein